MSSRSQRRDSGELPWGVPAVLAVWLIWLMTAHISRVLLDVYSALSPLRMLGAASQQDLRAALFPSGALVAATLVVPALIAFILAFRIVARRYQGAPLEALAFTRQNSVWVLAVVVLLGVLLTLAVQYVSDRAGFPLPLLEPPAGFPAAFDAVVYAVGVPLTALFAGLLVFGFCYPVLVARLGVWAGGLVCAAAFALPQLAGLGVYWQAAASLLVMGVFLTAVRRRTDSAYTAALGYTGIAIYIALAPVLAEFAIA